MAILAVGGELECFRVDPPADRNFLASQYLRTFDDPKFNRLGMVLGSPGFHLDLPQATRSVWLHMRWEQTDAVKNDPCFVFMHNNVALARFRRTQAQQCYVETSYNGSDNWTRRTNFINDAYSNYATRKYITWDIHIVFGASSGTIDVYREGARVGSYVGAMFTAFDTCNGIMVYATAGPVTEIIVADESTIGLRLYTQTVPDVNTFGTFTAGWDRSGTGPLTNVILVNLEGFYPDLYWFTGNKNQLFTFNGDVYPISYDYQNPTATIDLNNYNIKAVAVAAAMSNLVGGNVDSAQLVLTDGLTKLDLSPDMNVTPTIDGYIYRVQHVWNDSPFTFDMWSHDEIYTLQFGVKTR